MEPQIVLLLLHLTLNISKLHSVPSHIRKIIRRQADI